MQYFQSKTGKLRFIPIEPFSNQVSSCVSSVKRSFSVIFRTLCSSRPSAFVAAIWISLSGFNLSATTILKMDIDEIVSEAELIFEGQVRVKETRQDANTGIINTFVTFDITDVVKGEFNGDNVELKFMGGSFNGEVVQVSGLTIPAEGEHGIYFVESLNRDLINPLLGWSQGHFIISDQDRKTQVRTVDNKPVIRVESVAEIPVTIKKARAISEGNNQVAAGVVTEVNPGRIDRALTVDEFKIRIKDLLEN